MNIPDSLHYARDETNFDDNFTIIDQTSFKFIIAQNNGISKCSDFKVIK